MKLQIVYCRRRTLGSWVLRLFMWSSWSHCAIVTPDDTVIEAAASSGVVERPVAEFAKSISKFEVKQIEVDSVDRALWYARSQIGQPYDWWAVIGLGLRREWSDEDAWFCSEFTEAAIQAGGRIRFDRQPHRITPQLSYMVA